MPVWPSPDSATEDPSLATPELPAPTSLAPNWVQAVPIRVNTHAAPRKELSSRPPTSAVLPSAESATDWSHPWALRSRRNRPASFPVGTRSWHRTG